MAPLIDRVMQNNPYIYVKSHPRGAEGIPRIELHLSTTSEESKAAKKRIGKAVIQVSELIQVKGGMVKPLKGSLEV